MTQETNVGAGLGPTRSSRSESRRRVAGQSVALVVIIVGEFELHHLLRRVALRRRRRRLGRRVREQLAAVPELGRGRAGSQAPRRRRRRAATAGSPAAAARRRRRRPSARRRQVHLRRLVGRGRGSLATSLSVAALARPSAAGARRHPLLHQNDETIFAGARGGGAEPAVVEERDAPRGLRPPSRTERMRSPTPTPAAAARSPALPGDLDAEAEAARGAADGEAEVHADGR